MPARSEIASPVQKGEIVGGKYRVGEVLGAGGMGVVVAAEHVSFEQRVAVKVMHLDAGLGKLVGPEAYSHRVLTWPSELDDRTKRLHEISLAVVPALAARALEIEPRDPNTVQSISIRIFDSVPLWEVSTTHSGTVRFDVEGNYVGDP